MLLRAGGATVDELAAAIDGTTSLLEHLEAVRNAAVRQHAARNGTFGDLTKAMHLESRATAQYRRNTLLKKPPGELEKWAADTTS
ncbi:hypothetical protein [Streptomyces sp. NPDC058240]|uniref:hypothetical protein n=1 Tax=Streptomyces sp. NPDC058240 TaxID=3346396 RepID=UPI0036E97B65